MAKRIESNHRGLRPFVMAIALCASGVALSQVSTDSANAWSFGESPTKAFAVDGFVGIPLVEASGPAQVLEDESGNIYRVGSTAGTIDVDPGTGTTLVGDGVTDSVFYVAKYSANGDFLWARDWKPAGGNELWIYSSSIGPGGYVVLGGYVAAPTGYDLDPTSGTDVVTSTNSDPFILRINADGSYGWGSTFPMSGGGDGTVEALSVSATGAVTAAITFTGTISLFGTPIPSAGSSDVAIIRFDSTLSTMTWLTTIRGSGGDWVRTLDIAPDGKIFVTGGLASSSVTVTDAAASMVTVTRSSSATSNSYFVSLSSDGFLQYAVPRSLGATDNEPRAASVSSSGILLAALATGELVEVSTSGVITSKGTIGALISDVMYTSTGQVITIGKFISTADFDPGSTTQNRTSAGGADGYVLKLSSDFSFNSVQVFATATLDEVNSITPSVENGYLISGLTLGTSLNLSNTEYAGTYTRSAGADSFGFVIRYDASGTSGLTTTTTTTTTTPAAVVTTTTVPTVAAPARVSYVTGNKKVVVKWGAVSGASGYTVLSASGATLCNVNTTSCSLASLKNGKMYSVSVKSKNSAGVVSANATTLKVIPGFALKVATYKVKKTPQLSAIVSTPSKGAKKWRLVSGKCAIRSGRLVTPKTPGTCRLQLSVAKTKTYPAMATTIVIAITR